MGAFIRSACPQMPMQQLLLLHLMLISCSSRKSFCQTKPIDIAVATLGELQSCSLVATPSYRSPIKPLRCRREHHPPATIMETSSGRRAISPQSTPLIEGRRSRSQRRWQSACSGANLQHPHAALRRRWDLQAISWVFDPCKHRPAAVAEAGSRPPLAQGQGCSAS